MHKFEECQSLNSDISEHIPSNLILVDVKQRLSVQI